MFLRYIRLLVIVFGVFTVVTFAVIIPVTTAGIHSNLQGLERISWSKSAQVLPSHYTPF